jgi:cation transport ATPase
LIHHDNRDEAFLFSDDNGEPSHSHHSGSHAAHAAHHDHHHDGHHHSSPAAHHVHSHYEQQQPSQQLHHEDYQLHEHHMYEDHGNSSQNFDTVGNANDSTQHTSSPQQQQQQQQQQHSRNEDLFSSSRVMQLNLDEIDALATSHRSKPWLVVLYAPWCTYCQVHFLLPLTTIFSFPFSVDKNTSHLGICVHMHAPGLLPFQKKKRIITMKIVF